MRKYKSFLTVTLFAVFSGMFVSCKPNEHYVSFCMPDAQIDGSVVKFITAYALEEYVGEDASDFTNGALNVASQLVKKLHGGVPISGELTLEAKYIDFKPMMGSSLVTSGCREIRIPMKDVKAIRDETYMKIYEAVIVTTVNGEFKFMVTPKYMGSSEGKDICDQIKAGI